jgi:hypothetical protein
MSRILGAQRHTFGSQGLAFFEDGIGSNIKHSNDWNRNSMNFVLLLFGIERLSL